MVRGWWIGLVSALAWVASAFGGDTREPLRVVVTIPPLTWPVHELLGHGSDAIKADVMVLVPAGASEHGFELTASQVNALRTADLVVMAGNGLEPQVERALSRGGRERRKIVTLEGLAPAQREACEHEHGHDDGHDHGTVDPHLWLDPVVMEGFVERLAAALDERVGVGAEHAVVTARKEFAKAQCRAVDAEYRGVLSGLAESSRTIVTHHHAYAYLCARYGLTVAAVIRPVESVEPRAGDVMKAVEALKSARAKALFVEPQFPKGAAERIARAAGVKMLVLDPLGDGDWPAMMRRNLAALKEGLTE